MRKENCTFFSIKLVVFLDRPPRKQIQLLKIEERELLPYTGIKLDISALYLIKCLTMLQIV